MAGPERRGRAGRVAGRENEKKCDTLDSENQDFAERIATGFSHAECADWVGIHLAAAPCQGRSKTPRKARAVAGELTQDR
jgi:hypothetical protein